MKFEINFVNLDLKMRALTEKYFTSKLLLFDFKCRFIATRLYFGQQTDDSHKYAQK